jgi:hypothetical protein
MLASAQRGPGVTYQAGLYLEPAVSMVIRQCWFHQQQKKEKTMFDANKQYKISGYNGYGDWTSQVVRGSKLQLLYERAFAFRDGSSTTYMYSPEDEAIAQATGFRLECTWEVEELDD